MEGAGAFVEAVVLHLAATLFSIYSLYKHSEDQTCIGELAMELYLVHFVLPAQHYCRQKKGKYTRLVGRHANYNIGSKAAERWVHHMKEAVESHEALKDDAKARELLVKYFQYTAHYIVAASDYMRPDQVCVIWVQLYPSKSIFHLS